MNQLYLSPADIERIKALDPSKMDEQQLQDGFTQMRDMLLGLLPIGMGDLLYTLALMLTADLPEKDTPVIDAVLVRSLETMNGQEPGSYGLDLPIKGGFITISARLVNQQDSAFEFRLRDGQGEIRLILEATPPPTKSSAETGILASGPA